MRAHTKENFDQLIDTCTKIISVSKENVNGDLMYTQLFELGSSITEFLNNPIITSSGLNKVNSDYIAEIATLEYRLKNLLIINFNLNKRDINKFKT